MEERFAQRGRKQKGEFSPELTRLGQQIEETKVEINAARNHFEQAVDPTLIDCYIYEINAAQLRYQFLLRRFKAQEEAAAARSLTSQEVTEHAHLVRKSRFLSHVSAGNDRRTQRES